MPSASHVASVSAVSPYSRPEAPTGKKWIHEIKHDGFRIVARRVDGVVRLQTKQGYDYAERYPLIVEAISSLKVSSIVDRRRGHVFHRRYARLRQALKPHS